MDGVKAILRGLGLLPPADPAAMPPAGDRIITDANGDPVGPQTMETPAWMRLPENVDRIPRMGMGVRG